MADTADKTSTPSTGDAKGKGKAQRTETILMGVALAAIVVVGGTLAVIELMKSPGTDWKPEQGDPFADPSHPGYVAPDQLGYAKQAAFESDLDELFCVNLTADGDVLASGRGGVRRFSPEGELEQSWNFAETVRAVAPRSDGGFYACIEDRVELYGPDGEQQAVWAEVAPGLQLSAVEPAGEHVYVASIDSGAKKGEILRLSAEDGSVQKRFGSLDEDRENGLNIPGRYLDIEWRDGLLYVTNPGRHQINAYDAEGELKMTAGMVKWTHDGFSGCCNPVTVTTLPDGSFITSEKGLPRVKQMTSDKGLVTMVMPPKDFPLKHSFGIDLRADGQGNVYVAETGHKKIFVYRRKEGNDA